MILRTEVGSGVLLRYLAEWLFQLTGGEIARHCPRILLFDRALYPGNYSGNCSGNYYCRMPRVSIKCPATPCAPLPVGMCSAAIPIPTGKSNVSSGISSGTTLSSSGKFQHQMQQRKTSSPSGVSACTSFSPKQQRA
ncbi:unnamed protein product, partial [Anisakis simplex]|uniref:Uncharacterized protein n=1 Tax=Anisakis simplex TaxID=6269 RepID=A0A0M3JMD5_ANISI